MTVEARADLVHWHVFDNVLNPDASFLHRWESLTNEPDILVVPQNWIPNEEHLLAYEDETVKLGYEGVILRDPKGKYKNGRSTLKEGIMLKLKRFLDDEAKVVGFEELMHNANPAEKDERGLTKHSNHQAGQVPMDTLGAILVDWNGVEFKIGTGFTQLDREEIWKNQELYKGHQVKFKYLPTGMKNAPRHPVFLGFREEL